MGYRLQTSWNRTDYGCEWIGGGDWEEKTLYGDTTDFFITGIVLHDRTKSCVQEMGELISELNAQYNENKKLISSAEDLYAHKGQELIHKLYGRCLITEISDKRVRVKFRKTKMAFVWPDSIMQGYFSVPEYQEQIEVAKKKWQENEHIENTLKVFKHIYENKNDIACLLAMWEYKNAVIRLGKKEYNYPVVITYITSGVVNWDLALM